MTQIKRFRWDDLEKARQLQLDAVKLHLPSPPVAWWDAQVFTPEGDLKEHIQCKCNSFVRNGLNLIATAGIAPATTVRATGATFADGTISYKTRTGTNSAASWYGYSSTPTLYLGTSSTAETLNDVNLGGVIATGWTIYATVQTSSWNAGTRTLRTAIARTFVNDTGLSVDLWEAGVSVTLQIIGSSTSFADVLITRDVFPVVITVPASNGITFTYNLDAVYP